MLWRGGALCSGFWGVNPKLGIPGRGNSSTTNDYQSGFENGGS